MGRGRTARNRPDGVVMAPQTEVAIPASGVRLGGTLTVPGGPYGVVVFAHGSGSSRFSPRNRSVAQTLNDAGLATLLMDLLTQDEEEAERSTRHLRFDVGMLAGRLGGAIDWLREELSLPAGLFGASTGAAAALVVAAGRPEDVRAVVSRGGRPDLAGDALPLVRAPTLLIVGGADPVVIDLNRRALEMMAAPAELEIVPRSSHLFEEPGALEAVAALARDWFLRYLAGDGS
jgi:putative phosphoribosyl transferase